MGRLCFYTCAGREARSGVPPAGLQSRRSVCQRLRAWPSLACTGIESARGMSGGRGRVPGRCWAAYSHFRYRHSHPEGGHAGGCLQARECWEGACRKQTGGGPAWTSHSSKVGKAEPPGWWSASSPCKGGSTVKIRASWVPPLVVSLPRVEQEQGLPTRPGQSSRLRQSQVSWLSPSSRPPEQPPLPSRLAEGLHLCWPTSFHSSLPALQKGVCVGGGGFQPSASLGTFFIPTGF